MSPPPHPLELSLAGSLGVLGGDEASPDLDGADSHLARAALASLEVERAPVPAGSWEALAARLRTQAPLGSTPKMTSPRVTLSCTYCHDELVRKAAVYCATCLAPHHESCFAEHGRCCILGCEEDQVVRAGALGVPAVQAPASQQSPRRPFPQWAAAAAALLALLGGVYLSYTKVSAIPAPTESVHPLVATTYPSGSTLLEVTWPPADRPIKPESIDWENLSGEPEPERLLLHDGVATVEWLLPRLDRSIFLVRGLAEGETSFKLFYPASNRLVTYRVEVSGDDPHLRARYERRLEFDRKSPRELAREVKDSFRTAEAFTRGRSLPGKEGYYRMGWETVGRALDAAEALAQAEGRRGGRTQATVSWVAKCEEAEERLLADWQTQLELEFTRYRAMVARESASSSQRKEQLRTLLRLIKDPCDARYRRLEVFLREAHGETLPQRTACPFEGQR